MKLLKIVRPLSKIKPGLLMRDGKEGLSAIRPFGRVTFENAVMFLVTTLIFLDPWHTFIARAIGVSIYSPLVLITLFLLVSVIGLGEIDQPAPRVKSIYFIYAATCLSVLIFIRFSPVAGGGRILGSVIVPLCIGLLLSLLKCKRELGCYFGGALLIKVAILLPLASTYFNGYPKRPEIFGEAIYLLLGVGLDAFVGAAIFAFSNTQNWSRLFAALLLFLLAFNILGLNSRGLLVSSLFIAFLAVFSSRDKFKSAALGLLIYIVGVILFLILLPGRLEHLNSLLGTLLRLCGLGYYQAHSDTSAIIRADSILWLAQMKKVTLLGQQLTPIDGPVLEFHFFPLVIFFGAGLVGFSLFMILWGRGVYNALKLIKLEDVESKIIGFFIIGTALQIWYWGLLFNSQVTFIILGFSVGYVVPVNSESKSTNFIE